MRLLNYSVESVKSSFLIVALLPPLLLLSIFSSLCNTQPTSGYLRW